MNDGRPTDGQTGHNSHRGDSSTCLICSFRSCHCSNSKLRRRILSPVAQLQFHKIGLVSRCSSTSVNHHQNFCFHASLAQECVSFRPELLTREGHCLCFNQDGPSQDSTGCDGATMDPCLLFLSHCPICKQASSLCDNLIVE